MEIRRTAVPDGLAAAMAIQYRLQLPAAGVPVRTAVPFWLSVNERPAGRVPVSVKAGAGYPFVWMSRCSLVPAAAWMVPSLAIAGALVMVRVNVWVAVPAVFRAVRVTG